MAKGRIQNRHGTYSQFTEVSTPLLPEEIGIVDSGHPDTSNGKAMYYRGTSGDPVRVANDDEVLKIREINDETVPESVNWYDRQGNAYIPTDFQGFTGKAPELVYFDLSIWVLYHTQPDPQTGTVSYIWARMLTSDD